ncbi:MAG: xylose isomerase, partial [Alphaproteobacteria bacterium]|nr:xylose isomerase [Alphaproteobacteria bacterium]
EDGQIDAFRVQRYAGWQGELGRKVHASGTTLVDIAEHAIQANHLPEPRSGRQEWCENLVNRF